MTEKLYYTNAYIKEFDSEVVSVTKREDGFAVVLSKTAFFPEEGGQSSDSGYIEGARVKHVYEESGIIYHLTDTAPEGETVHCTLDFDERFEKMQCHTAEHILCGFVHKLYGLSNVGFHLGDDEVTFDVDGILSREQLDKVEQLANAAVFANVKIDTFFPTQEQISTLEYRSKLDFTDGVRIVKIGDYDSCACCAPHVAYTGEVGLIKILDFMKHRGGTRIWMVAGKRALSDYRLRYENIKRISAMLCAPQLETADTLERYIADSEASKIALKQARLKIAELEAQTVEARQGDAVFYHPDFQIPELIAFSNIANKKIEGILVAISGTEGDYKYVISSSSVDLRAMSKDINTALSGRGGGRPEMIQGSFNTTIEKIKEYFK